jgi:hypothetical protein
VYLNLSSFILIARCLAILKIKYLLLKSALQLKQFHHSCMLCNHNNYSTFICEFLTLVKVQYCNKVF